MIGATRRRQNWVFIKSDELEIAAFHVIVVETDNGNGEHLDIIWNQPERTSAVCGRHLWHTARCQVSNHQMRVTPTRSDPPAEYANAMSAILPTGVCADYGHA
jgi:hypothetical protein